MRPPRRARPQRVETIIERQQRVAPEGDDDGFLFDRKDRRARCFGPVRRSATVSWFFDLATVFGLMP
jgi:hypothetical protein